MSNNQDRFEELVERVKRGEREAMEELITRYEKEIALVAKFRLGSSLRPYLDEEDIVQSVHRSLILGLRDGRIELRSPEALVGFAALMVRRKVARKWRKERRQHRLSWVGQATKADAMVETLAGFSSRSGDPQFIAQLKEELAKLLNQLDETDRSLLQLRLLGYRTVEAATELGVNADVARVRLSRLRKKLAEANLDLTIL